MDVSPASFFDRSPQNGWPSVTSSSVQPNGPNAVASVSSEQVRYIFLTAYAG